MPVPAGRDLRAVLFDLDGTLIDSIELIVRSYRHTFRVHGVAGGDEVDVLASIGRPLRAALAAHARDETELETMVATYRVWNAAHHDELVRPYPGVGEAVRALHGRGLSLGVVTSKARCSALRGLAACGLDAYFRVTVAADDVERHKPDPAPVLQALDGLGVRPGRAMLVGDSVQDVEAGRRAGVTSVAVAWGPHPRAVLEGARPDLWVERPEELGGLAGPLPGDPQRSAFS